MIGITSLRNQIQELIEVSIDRTLLLKVGGGFKAGDSSNISVGRAKFPFEFPLEVFPVLSSLHVRKGPDNFSLVIREVVQRQMDVGLARAEEAIVRKH